MYPISFKAFLQLVRSTENVWSAPPSSLLISGPLSGPQLIDVSSGYFIILAVLCFKQFCRLLVPFVSSHGETAAPEDDRTIIIIVIIIVIVIVIIIVIVIVIIIVIVITVSLSLLLLLLLLLLFDIMKGNDVSVSFFFLTTYNSGVILTTELHKL